MSDDLPDHATPELIAERQEARAQRSLFALSPFAGFVRRKVNRCAARFTRCLGRPGRRSGPSWYPKASVSLWVTA